MRELAAHPDAAAAGPRLIDERGVAELSFGWTISVFGELRQKIIGALYRLGAPLVRAASIGGSATPAKGNGSAARAMLVASR